MQSLFLLWLGKFAVKKNHVVQLKLTNDVIFFLHYFSLDFNIRMKRLLLLFLSHECVVVLVLKPAKTAKFEEKIVTKSHFDHVVTSCSEEGC